MTFFKKEFDKNDNALEMLVNVAIPYTGDKYLRSMILYDQNNITLEPNQPVTNKLNTHSKMIYARELAEKYVIEGALLIAAAQTLLH